MSNLESLNPREYILIKGAEENNLKNVDIAIQRNQFIVITGMSGSGKTSLAFDTIYAEGHRLYIESLSSYSRQFVGKIKKPKIEYIKGLSPTKAIKQHTSIKNPRSTVGSITEIYDYLRSLFTRIGTIFSPKSGQIVKKDTIQDVEKYINGLDNGIKIYITFPLAIKTNTLREILKLELLKGFSRIVLDYEILDIETILESDDLFEKINKLKTIEILVDRIKIRKNDEDIRFKISDSSQTAFYEGKGFCIISNINDKTKKSFSDLLERDNITFEEPSINFFNFNSSYGSCKKCNGTGIIFDVIKEKIISNTNLSISEGAVVPWESPNMHKWLEPLLFQAKDLKFPLTTSYSKLSEKHKKIIWKGSGDYKGINSFFEFLDKNSRKIQYKAILHKYKGNTQCSDCLGTKIRQDARYVKIDNKSIVDLLSLPLGDLKDFFDNIKLSKEDILFTRNILEEIKSRISYLLKVGVEYLTLSRATNSLSGGEYQRINLASSLGSFLVGTIYVLDEPTIGLHPRDVERLVKVIKDLKDCENTVIVVEHEEEVMKAADQIIDIGPEAGKNGGEVVFQGTIKEIYKSKGITGQYLSGRKKIEIPKKRRKWDKSFKIIGARENNLKNLNTEIPLSVMTVITGVSGSGKSTLLEKIIYPAIGDNLYLNVGNKGLYEKLEGDYECIKNIEFINQNPMMKSSRSNTVTYVKAYDNIRTLFANQPLAISRGYSPSKFSFNIKGGRCEECNGEGIIKIEMQFMPDITLVCDECNGKRFQNEILEIKYKNKSISEVLKMSVKEAIPFFNEYYEIFSKLQILNDVGLGYLELGQSTSTLSGGEAQRVKLASFIKNHKNKEGHTLYIFDEPTTGLHFADIDKLLISLNRLVDLGNTVIVIEHDLDIIKSSDWIINLGPEGGKHGGEITFAGVPEDMIKLKDNPTAKYLKKKF